MNLYYTIEINFFLILNPKLFAVVTAFHAEPESSFSTTSSPLTAAFSHSRSGLCRSAGCAHAPTGKQSPLPTCPLGRDRAPALVSGSRAQSSTCSPPVQSSTTGSSMTGRPLMFFIKGSGFRIRTSGSGSVQGVESRPN